MRIQVSCPKCEVEMIWLQFSSHDRKPPAEPGRCPGCGHSWKLGDKEMTDRLRVAIVTLYAREMF